MKDEQRATSATQELYGKIFKALKEFDQAVPTPWIDLGPGDYRLMAYRVVNDVCLWKGCKKLEVYPDTLEVPECRGVHKEEP